MPIRLYELGRSTSRAADGSRAVHDPAVALVSVGIGDIHATRPRRIVARQTVDSIADPSPRYTAVRHVATGVRRRGATRRARTGGAINGRTVFAVQIGVHDRLTGCPRYIGVRAKLYHAMLSRPCLIVVKMIPDNDVFTGQPTECWSAGNARILPAIVKRFPSVVFAVVSYDSISLAIDTDAVIFAAGALVVFNGVSVAGDGNAVVASAASFVFINMIVVAIICDTDQLQPGFVTPVFVNMVVVASCGHPQAEISAGIEVIVMHDAVIRA